MLASACCVKPQPARRKIVNGLRPRKHAGSRTKLAGGKFGKMQPVRMKSARARLRRLALQPLHRRKLWPTPSLQRKPPRLPRPHRQLQPHRRPLQLRPANPRCVNRALVSAWPAHPASVKLQARLVVPMPVRLRNGMPTPAARASAPLRPEIGRVRPVIVRGPTVPAAPPAWRLSAMFRPLLRPKRMAAVPAPQRRPHGRSLMQPSLRMPGAQRVRLLSGRRAAVRTSLPGHG